MRRHKYNAIPTIVDGIQFASRKEAKRYGELKFLQRLGEISDLELQPRFPIEVSGVKVCEYRADFRYRQAGVVVVEDAKGFKTPEYKLKKKMVKAQYGIDVQEV